MAHLIPDWPIFPSFIKPKRRGKYQRNALRKLFELDRAQLRISSDPNWIAVTGVAPACRIRSSACACDTGEMPPTASATG